MSISLPTTTFNILPAIEDIGNTPHRVLLVGCQSVGSSAQDAGVLVTDIGAEGQEGDLFGSQSHLAMLVRNFRKYNKQTPVDAIGFTDAGGALATGAINVLGTTATENRTVRVVIGSEDDISLPVSVVVGDTPTTTAAKIVAKINAVTIRPCSASNVAGAITLTMLDGWQGAIGNNVTIDVSNMPAGLGIQSTAFTGGTLDAASGLGNVTALLANNRYQGIVWPGEISYEILDEALTAAFNVENKIRDGQGFIYKIQTAANMVTYTEDLNNPLITVWGEPAVSFSINGTTGDGATGKGGVHREFADGIAAGFAAIRALRLTDNRDIAPFVIGTNQGKDQFGGIHTASLPYFNTPLTRLPRIRKGYGYTDLEVSELNEVGCSVIANNIPGTASITGHVLTTYKTDSAGNPNKSFKYLEYVDTIVAIREYFFNNCKAHFAQTRLTTGDLIPGYTMANEASIAAYLVSLYGDMAALPLAVAGEAAVKAFKKNLTVEIDAEEGTVYANMTVPIVVQLRTIIANIRIAFTPE